ncbi:MAG: nitrous oxide-stimulated promoter family protein [Paludibacteraceae bacterium]
MSSIHYEKETIDTMIRLYCWKKHGSKKGELCANCNALNVYARRRLEKCPFGDEKMACEKCPIHCYKPVEREKMRQVMRFSGPRMLIYHPRDFLIHIFKDRMRRKSDKKN